MLLLSSKYRSKQRGEGRIRDFVVCIVTMQRMGISFETDRLWDPHSLLFKGYWRLCLGTERPEIKISHSPPYTRILYKRFHPFRFLKTKKQFMKLLCCVCVLRPLANFQGTWCECYTFRCHLNAAIYNYLQSEIITWRVCGHEWWQRH
jgi:hypothetical protein